VITLDDVKPGDVLLFHGRGLIPWAIRLFDGSEVNHAAIAMPNGTLYEAGGSGLRSSNLAEACSSAKYTLVRRLDGQPLDPVLARADTLFADRSKYAYHQILLLVLLAMTRRIPAPRAARRLLRSALDHAATAVGDLVPTGKQRMICSEYVYRCYAEAVEASTNPYLLAVDLASVFAAVDDAGGDVAEGTYLDWALAQDDREVDLGAPDVSFGGDDAEPVDGLDPLDHAEAEIEALIVDYAEEAGLADTLPDEPIAVSPTFADDAVPEPTDDELLASMARFGLALQDTAAGPVSPTFDGGIAAVIGAAALKGALAGIADISVDPNFVTPRDLLKSTSLNGMGRIG
jgi:hypothetical protein